MIIYQSRTDELKLDQAAAALLGRPAYVVVEPYADGLLITAADHVSLVGREVQFRKVKDHDGNKPVLKVSPRGAVLLGLVEGNYRYVQVSPGQILAMPA